LAANQCSDRKLNSCDDNADCVQLPDGYTCKCFSGYVDVSSNANLEPGRVCTLSTVCPVQATDLVFLIDGSGSIGSYIFQTETSSSITFPEHTPTIAIVAPEIGIISYLHMHYNTSLLRYLTGLTRTGAAIEHVATEAFSERRGARPLSDSVARVAIVITDGRSQDNVTTAANNARRQNIQLFAVGVTNHVLQAELEEITGAKDRTFHVNAFEDLNTRLRSAIQRVTCPQNEAPKPSGPCDPSSHAGCDRALNQVCMLKNGQYSCTCPEGFEEHPVTKACGGDVCNPEIPTSCPDPEICEKTPFGNWRCTCPADLGWRDLHTGACKIGEPPQDLSESQDECDPADSASCGPNAKCVRGPGGSVACQCDPGYVINIKSDKCQKPGTCDPSVPNSCDARKKEKCLLDSNGDYTCQCDASQFYKRHNVTEICLIDECSAGTHDCDVNARCTDTDESFICTCNSGFLDKSPDQARKPGRVCTQLHNECEENRHNCSKNADCIDLPDGFLCRCKESFVDVSPNMKVFAGLDCRALVDECASKTTNNCHEHAICIDTRDAYKCQCKTGYVDHDELRNPGRDCRKGEILSTLMSSSKSLPKLSMFRCKPDYHDQNPSDPGTNCKFIINECSAENLNDCDKKAECIDTIDGYECKCIAPYVDQMPQNPGRVCRFNECADPKSNDCDKNADCIDTDDGFICQCKQGFFDENTDPLKTGRVCVGLVIDKPQESEKTTISPNLVPCGNTFCKIDLHEVCIGGSKCDCRPGESRSSPNDKCVAVTSVPIVVRVIDFDGEPLQYSTDYSKPTSPEHVQIVEDAVKGLGEVFRQTDIAPRYVTTDINYITNPKVENSTWDRGLLINGSVKLSGDENVDRCKLFKDFAAQVFVSNMKSKIEVVYGTSCGTMFCNEALGEECIAGKLCGCPKGQKRKDAQSPCRVVESFNLPLYVIRDGNNPLKYTPAIANPRDDRHKELVDRFETGIAQSYNKTPIKNGFVSVEVNDIEEPSLRNASWISGILYNFTTHFVRGTVSAPSMVFTDLVDYIIKKNNYEVGQSKLFISPDQMNPFTACYGSDCHPNAICTALGKGYSCQCPNGYRDLNPSHPGRQCLAYVGVNECEKPELNECSPDARCIDLDYLYKCECISPYVNAAPEGAVPGSVCTIDYCSDVHYCPLNSTCKNIGDQAKCDCNPGFVDLRKSDRLSEAGLGDTICLRLTDVNECALGLHNCSAAAICIDQKIGYDCKCPDGYTDGNPAEPGRVCAALLCGLCNGHGDCIHDSVTNNVTCSCVDGYGGQFCELAPSNAGLILMTILALLFLLLTLLCCLYLCARCRCFGARGISEGSASGREILGSDYYTIPRAKLKPLAYGDEAMGHDNAAVLGAYLDDGASVSSDGSLEEIERRVTTDVTTREIRTTTVRDEMGNVVSQSQTVLHGPFETDTEQYAVTSSDHFRQASGAAGATAASVHGSSAHISSGVQGASSMGEHMRTEGYESDSDAGSDAGRATYDRVTRVSQSHDFLPGGDPRTGTERRRNEVRTTTTAEEVNYF
uniref:VWFA domain-containing protein n=1 Tax=Haemonchus placei TaxID=6290 RepID=A0A158QLB9_HAEPC